METIGLLGGMELGVDSAPLQPSTRALKRPWWAQFCKGLYVQRELDEIEKAPTSRSLGRDSRHLINAALSVEKGGVDFILICTNTMHKVVPEIEEKITIPILHRWYHRAEAAWTGV